jgi:hypothetical protein
MIRTATLPKKTFHIEGVLRLFFFQNIVEIMDSLRIKMDADTGFEFVSGNCHMDRNDVRKFCVSEMRKLKCLIEIKNKISHTIPNEANPAT